MARKSDYMIPSMARQSMLDYQEVLESRLRVMTQERDTLRLEVAEQDRTALRSHKKELRERDKTIRTLEEKLKYSETNYFQLVDEKVINELTLRDLHAEIGRLKANAKKEASDCGLRLFARLEENKALRDQISKLEDRISALEDCSIGQQHGA